MAGRVMMVEEETQTVFGENVPGRVTVVEEVAQTVFGVNVPDRDRRKRAWMSHSGGRGSTDSNVTGQVKEQEGVAP